MAARAQELAPELADAADVLSDQLHAHLHRLSKLVDAATWMPLNRVFRASLNRKRILPIQAAALSAITFGAAARILARDGKVEGFIGPSSSSNRSSTTAAGWPN